jgi:hypothetical protein
MLGFVSLAACGYSLLMGEMRVDVEGLEDWSAQCVTIAGELAAASLALPSLPSRQATSTAVSTGQALVDGTSTFMATRVRGTGTNASAAATAHAANDEESAQRLAAVSPGPVVG